MSLRFGSGWLVIYFLICSCTFRCSAPQLRARDYTTFNPFEPLPFSVTPDTRFWVTFSPLQGRAALTVEVTRPRGRPASRCCVGALQNSQRLEMFGAPRSGQRGWSTCTPSRVHIPDVGNPDCDLTGSLYCLVDGCSCGSTNPTRFASALNCGSPCIHFHSGSIHIRTSLGECSS